MTAAPNQPRAFEWSVVGCPFESLTAYVGCKPCILVAWHIRVAGELHIFKSTAVRTGVLDRVRNMSNVILLNVLGCGVTFEPFARPTKTFR